MRITKSVSIRISCFLLRGWTRVVFNIHGECSLTVSKAVEMHQIQKSIWSTITYTFLNHEIVGTHSWASKLVYRFPKCSGYGPQLNMWWEVVPYFWPQYFQTFLSKLLTLFPFLWSQDLNLLRTYNSVWGEQFDDIKR